MPSGYLMLGSLNGLKEVTPEEATELGKLYPYKVVLGSKFSLIMVSSLTLILPVNFRLAGSFALKNPVIK
jgi:hypothetical protein